MLYCTRKFYRVRGFGFEQLNLIAASPTATHENPGVETRLEILNLRGKLGGEGKVNYFISQCEVNYKYFHSPSFCLANNNVAIVIKEQSVPIGKYQSVKMLMISPKLKAQN